MRPQTLELSKKYVFSQITFFKKVKEANIHSGIFYRHMLEKKKFFSKFFFPYFYYYYKILLLWFYNLLFITCIACLVYIPCKPCIVCKPYIPCKRYILCKIYNVTEYTPNRHIFQIQFLITPSFELYFLNFHKICSFSWFAAT